jgi:hypothetical protein
MPKAPGLNRRRKQPVNRVRATPAVSTSVPREILFKASGPPAVQAAGAG